MEPLILYFVLFFPGIFASPFPAGLGQGIEAALIPFSTLRELGRTLTYTIPSLALLWYLISDKKGLSALDEVKPRLRDFIPFAIGFPSLVIIGLGISFPASYFSGYLDLPLPPRVDAPLGLAGWIAMVFSCLGTGYLEESYFRYYLLIKLENPLPRPAFRIFLSTLLFSLCHIYEGPWGILNAVLAGVLLSVLFIRYRSLHGIAWAHAAYNMFVYVSAMI
jgi:membrane protease YdiL (CAAX protease family)